MVLGSPKRDQLLAEIKCRHIDKEYHEFSHNEREVIAEEGHFGSRSPDARERARNRGPLYCTCGRMLSDEVKVQCHEQKFRTLRAATRIVWSSCKIGHMVSTWKSEEYGEISDWEESDKTFAQKQEEIWRTPLRSVRCIT